jgi:hypothetical protein
VADLGRFALWVSGRKRSLNLDISRFCQSVRFSAFSFFRVFLDRGVERMTSSILMGQKCLSSTYYTTLLRQSYCHVPPLFPQYGATRRCATIVVASQSGEVIHRLTLVIWKKSRAGCAVACMACLNLHPPGCVPVNVTLATSAGSTPATDRTYMTEF